MEFDEINRILDMMREHELSEFELEREGFKIRIKKGAPLNAPASPAVPAVPHGAPAPQQPFASPPPPPLEAVPSPEAPPSDEVDFAIVKSPIVGTFFRSAEPGAAPFVEVGTTVKKGEVLCIIEAMKLMNEIEAETKGRVVRILVENAQPVEFGQKLFLVEPL